MTDKPRSILCEFIKAYGKEIIDDPVRFRNLIKDYFRGDFKKEQNCLTDAIEEDIPNLLLEGKQQVPYNLLSAQLIQRLTNIGYTSDLAKWSVDSWAIALGIIITETDYPQLKNRSAKVRDPPPQHQTGTSPSISPSSLKTNIIQKEVSKRVYKQWDKTAYIALGLFIFSIILMYFGDIVNIGITILGFFAFVGSLVLSLYAISKSMDFIDKFD